MKSFLNDPTALANGIAYSNRAVGNLARPFFPDGITGTANGPLSKPYRELEPVQRRSAAGPHHQQAGRVSGRG